MSRPFSVLFAAVLGLWTLSGCRSTDDRALVIFEIGVAADVPSFRTLRFVSTDNPDIPSRDLDGPSHRQPFRLGYFVPHPTGMVNVVGRATDNDDCVVGEGAASAAGVSPKKEIDAGPLVVARL